ncbi:MAG: hypothetical protein AAGA84_10705 [Pseudomonadota bacterium]
MIRIIVVFVLAALAWLPSRADIGDPLVVRDPLYGDVLFHFYTGNYFDALVRLSAAQQADKLTFHDDEAELLRGGLLLSYGQHTEAARVFDQLLAANTSPETRDRTWFFLAKIRYQRGFVAEAGAALEAIGDDLPKELEAERRMLHSQVLIKQARFADAIELLDGWKGPRGWIDYSRYNLGVALVRAGEFAEGARWLDRVGRLKDKREELRALRDKANLALGYTWLQNEQPDLAKPILQRVRLNGAFSSKALLGVGWADSDRGDYRQALVPWTNLAQRNLLDPAVQESLLAVPYALGKLNATRQSASQYEDAIRAFDNEQARLRTAIDNINTGQMLERLLTSTEERNEDGWFWELESLPDATENRYLYHLMATHRFQEALKNYRDVLQLRANLASWKDRVQIFRNIIDTRTAGYAQRLPQIESVLDRADLDALDSERQRLQTSLDEIVAQADVIALAPKRQQQLDAELRDFTDRPVLRYRSAEIDDIKTRLRLMQGVLQWQAEKDFDARVWHQRKQIGDIHRILVSAKRARAVVDDTRVSEPERLVDFDTRVTMLTPQIDQMLVKVERSLQRQRDYLHGLATEELEAQYARLATYTVQARFALAAVYDRATAASNDAGSTGAQP